MRILVLGGSGMLGHKIYQSFTAAGKDVHCTIHGSKTGPVTGRIPLFQTSNTHENVDAMDFDRVRAVLRDIRPDVLINCVGVIKQRDSAKASIPSITINSLLPHKLAEWQAEWSGKVIHFSTDCVFSGNKGAYVETDLSDAEDLYGKSKFLGEVQSDNAITLRTSIIGRELSHFQSLLEWFLRQDGKMVKGYTKAIYSGVTTNHLSDVVADLIDRNYEISGLFQVVSEPINKYDLLCKIKSQYKLKIEIEPVDGEICDRSMRGDKFHQATGYQCHSWDELIKQLSSDNTPYEKWSQG